MKLDALAFKPEVPKLCPMTLMLVSHHLCPYVQRVAIALAEKNTPFERTYIDLANKPDWFLAISPLGKTPVLTVDGTPVFESAAILEYLEETQPNPLHPSDPLRRAEHRAWIEFGTSILHDIWGFYAAHEEAAFITKVTALAGKFERLEIRLETGPYFDGDHFALVDAVFGPVFRYFEVFDQIDDFGVLANKPKVAKWRDALAARTSIKNAVTSDYNPRLWKFLKGRKSYLSNVMTTAGVGVSV